MMTEHMWSAWKRRAGLFLVLALSVGVWVSCRPKGVMRVAAPSGRGFPTAQLRPVRHPDWSYNASIYEVNLRQYSPRGTFAEFAEHLPRLRDMGVGILWFMPIHPIGEKNRKGTLGSYYSVKDYYGVNPEFGTLDEFKRLVAEIHAMGMYVIIDWVANHSAWDNPLAEEHPEWFTQDIHGNFVPPVEDWSDVIDLNYGNPDLWYYMIGAMKFWVRDVGIDGFRCDVAGMVPLDFWNVARAELDSIRPVFMLAEWEAPEAHDYAFDMTYSWDLYHLMNRIAKGSVPANAVGAYLERERETCSPDAYRMLFTSNHDENSWNGTVFERLGPAASVLAVLSATVEGMPLVYSGQEAGLAKRLQFFEKDEIDWRPHPMADLYTALLDLKRENRALWNGDSGGPATWLHTSNDREVFAFMREKDGDRVCVALNLSGEPQTVTLEGNAYAGDYRDAFSGEAVTLPGEAELELPPWGFTVFAASAPGRGLLTPPFLEGERRPGR
jgi:glycosidase